jgi:uncharacterized membrane protein
MAAPTRPVAAGGLPPGPLARSTSTRGPVWRLGGGLASLWRSFSGLGLMIGALFLAASLTPSLIPRSFLLQGVLGGVCFAIGYGVGVLCREIWGWLGLPFPGDRLVRALTWAAAAVAAAIVLSFLWKATGWQNSIRARMDMAPVESARPIEVAAIAMVVFVIVAMLGRLFARTFTLSRRFVGRYVPERVSRAIALAIAAALFLAVADGVLFRAFMRISDNSFAALDALIEPQYDAPTDPLVTGSPQSLVSWENLGRAGRQFIASGPTAERIGAFIGRAAKRPVRVYVGLNSADEIEDRARLLLDEMVRAGAFDRKLLVIATPTGTGWMDPAAMDTLEYLHDGDTAIVGMQYSYLTSWISLLVEPGYGSDAARAMFRAIYSYWTRLPHDHRPRLYLQGLSLGAHGSNQSFQLEEVIGDPFNGAVWSGPPFTTQRWLDATRHRNPGSPEWLPTFGDGSIIRFTNQENHLETRQPWGPMRLVYLQYASDPITFFSPGSLWRKPDWMTAPVGPDVSPELRWYPIVTFLQLGLDMAIGLAVPRGHGHDYAPEHYIDAWVAVTAPEDWAPADIDRLKAQFAG